MNIFLNQSKSENLLSTSRFIGIVLIVYATNFLDSIPLLIVFGLNLEFDYFSSLIAIFLTDAKDELDALFVSIKISKFSVNIVYHYR